MTKTQTQLIDRISRGTGIRRPVVREVVESLLDELLEELASGNEVRSLQRTS